MLIDAACETHIECRIGSIACASVLKLFSCNYGSKILGQSSNTGEILCWIDRRRALRNSK